MSIEIARSVTRNTSVLFLSQVVTWGSSFILMLFLPRYLGSEEYGRLYLAMSIMIMSHLVIDFGGGYFIPKEIARLRPKAPFLVVNSLAARLLLWVVMYGILLAFAHIVDYPPVVRQLIAILGFATVWEGLGKTMKNCFQGFERLEYSAIGAIAERVVVTAAGVGALLLGADVLVIALIMAGSTLLNTLISARLLRRLVPALPSVDLREGWTILKAGVPYFLWSVFAVVYYRIDAVMMSLMTPASVVGWYGAAYRFFDVLMFVPAILSTAVFPVMARLWKEGPGALAATTGKSLELIITAGILVSCCTFLFSREIIGMFFGLDEYGPAVLLLQLFAVGLPLVYIDMVLGTVILASDRQRAWSFVALGAIPVNIGLNMALIPVTQSQFGNGGLGAALATLVTEFLVMVAALHLVPKHLMASLRIGVVVKGICIIPGLWSVWLLLQYFELPWLLQALAVVITYAYALHSLGVVNPSEVAFLRNYFSPGNLRNAAFLRREAQL